MVRKRVPRFYAFDHAKNLTKKRLEAIGLVAVRGVELEDGLRQVVSWLLGVDPMHAESEIAFNHVIPHLLVDMIGALATSNRHIRGSEKKLSEILEQSKKAITERNRTVHAIWFSSDTPRGHSQRATLIARGKVTWHFKYMSAQEITAVANDLTAARRDLFDFFEKQLPPLRRRY